MTNSPLCPYCNTNPLIKKTCGHIACKKVYRKSYLQSPEYKAVKKAYRDRKKEQIIKLCPFCNQRPIKHKTCGHKNCQKACVKAHYKANKEKIREKNKIYREVNKEKLREQKKAYYYANKEQITELCPFCNQRPIKHKTCGHIACKKEQKKKQSKGYYNTNKEKLLERGKAYKKTSRQRPEVREREKAYDKAYRQRPEVREREKTYGKAYRQRPEVKERLQAYNQSPEYKEKKKAYRERPEVKERYKDYCQINKEKIKKIVKAYHQRPEVKAREKARRQNHEYKQKQREHKKAMYQNPDVKARQKAYRERPEVKERGLKTCPVCKLKKISKRSQRCIKCSISIIAISRHSITYLIKNFKVRGGELYNMKNQKLGYYQKDVGYCLISYYNKKFSAKFLSHRLIWTLEHKKHIKEGYCIDHINGVKLDNHPLNLRQVSHSDNIRLVFKNRVRTCQIIYALEQADVCIYSFSDMVLKYENLRRRVYDSYKERHRPQIGLTAGGWELYQQAIRELRDYRDRVYNPFLLKVFKEKHPSHNSLQYFAHNWKRLYGMGKAVGGFIANNKKSWDTLREQALQTTDKKDFGFYWEYKKHNTQSYKKRLIQKPFLKEESNQ